MTFKHWMPRLPRMAVLGAAALAALLAAGPEQAAAQNPTAGTDLAGKKVYLRKLSVLRYGESFTARIYTLTRVTLEVDGRGVCNDGWCPLTHNKVPLFARRTHIDVSVPQGAIVVSERTLRPGDQGDDVRAIQEVLIKKGAQIAADGSYGASTAAAVRDFQQKNGLVTDGEVGPETRKRLVG